MRSIVTCKGLLKAAIVVTMAICGPGIAGADESRIRELERKLDESVKAVDTLSRQVEKLEKDRAAGAKEGEVVAAPLGSEGVQPHGNGGSVWGALASEPGVFRAFADVGFALSSKRAEPDDRPQGFEIGSLDLFWAPRLGGNVKTLVELLFEYEHDGDLFTDLERIQLGYTFNDAVTLWLGRFHTPYGYWNTAFHHGRQIQTSVLRPHFLEFEDMGGILPSHMNGLWGTGAFDLAGGKASYDLYFTNGVRIIDVEPGKGGILNPNTVKDDNFNYTLGFNLGFSFSGTGEGLKVGAHGIKGRVDGYDQGGARQLSSELQMLGGYALYEAGNWEAMAEYYQFLNRNLTGAGGTFSSSAAYVQLGYALGSFTPYGRFEVVDIDQQDNYFSQLEDAHSYTREAAGLRYDITPKSCVKLEWNHTSITERVSENFDEMRMQYSVRF